MIDNYTNSLEAIVSDLNEQLTKVTRFRNEVLAGIQSTTKWLNETAVTVEQAVDAEASIRDGWKQWHKADDKALALENSIHAIERIIPQIH